VNHAVHFFFPGRKIDGITVPVLFKLFNRHLYDRHFIALDEDFIIIITHPLAETGGWYHCNISHIYLTFFEKISLPELVCRTLATSTVIVWFIRFLKFSTTTIVPSSW